MIVPSIDLRGGQAVQLEQGARLKIEAGSPFPLAERFGRVGEIAVIDLDAALGTGDNADLIEQLCRTHRCRVGGGIRSEAAARRWLDAGASKILLGTAATPELLSKLPKDRVMAALDARDGEVVVHGWTTKTGQRVEDQLTALAPYVSGFLVTFVEREGMLQGIDLDAVKRLVDAAQGVPLTIAGGVTTAQDIADLDRLGCDAQVGMALYSGRLGLAEAFAAPLRSDRPDGLFATVVVDEHERALGLAWSDLESLRHAIDTGEGAYHSRSRQGLWVKGATSGATQQVLRLDVDCDRDALRMMVRQAPPGFCHLDTPTCWGEDQGLPRLVRRLAARVAEAPEGSYTRRLLNDPALLRAKLLEEASELAAADTPEDVAWEAADVFYFAAVALARAGVPLSEVEQALDQRERAVTRRRGDAKPPLP